MKLPAVAIVPDFVMTARLGSRAQVFRAKGARVGFSVGELLVLSFVLQLCTLPLMARDFHRNFVAGAGG